MIAPRDRSSAVSDEIRASAARGLNEPVFWRCSALRYSRPSASSAPVAASTNRAAVADESIGVWWMRSPRRARIAWMLARVTRGVGHGASMRVWQPRAATTLAFLRNQ